MRTGPFRPVCPHWPHAVPDSSATRTRRRRRSGRKRKRAASPAHPPRWPPTTPRRRTRRPLFHPLPPLQRHQCRNAKLQPATQPLSRALMKGRSNCWRAGALPATPTKKRERVLTLPSLRPSPPLLALLRCRCWVAHAIVEANGPLNPEHRSFLIPHRTRTASLPLCRTAQTASWPWASARQF